MGWVWGEEGADPLSRRLQGYGDLGVVRGELAVAHRWGIEVAVCTEWQGKVTV